MESSNLYQDIAKRTDGDIYVGVVGPVRTGKSTFIKNFKLKFRGSSNQRIINVKESLKNNKVILMDEYMSY